MIILDKTNYSYFRQCPRFGWQKFHKKFQDINPSQELLSQQGYQIEALAQKLFPNGWEITGDREKTVRQTRNLINNPSIKILYQATALSSQHLLAKADIIKINHYHKNLNLYEVKMANDVGLSEQSSLKKAMKYLSDIAFQKIVFEQSGYKIKKTYLIHTDKNYQLKTQIVNPKKLLKIIDVTWQVNEILPQILNEIKITQKCYKHKKEPKCNCLLKPKIDRCPGFEKFHTKINKPNSILRLNGIRHPKIKQLVDKKVLKIEDIKPQLIKEIKFSDAQLKQIKVVQTKKPIIELKRIKNILKAITPPIYFLDYETINYPIPVFKNSHPYQQIVFQFSLHILSNENTKKASHHEHLLKEASSQALKELIIHLKTVIGTTGSIIVWHQSAEKTFQTSLKKLFPQFDDFFDNLNERLFDLKDVFSKQTYVHPDFGGSSSLKNVVPVITPQLNYSNLIIQDGRTASASWNEALEMSDLRAKERRFLQLLEYCYRDTYSMVEIYKFLQNLR